MGKSKWEKFRNTYSPVRMDNPNGGRNNVLSDWSRAANGDGIKLKVNGLELSSYATKYKIFSDPVKNPDFKPENKEENLRILENFFRDEILINMADSLESEKSEIVDYLKSHFHQGGLMYPVSSAIGECMVESDPNKTSASPYKYANIRSATHEQEINIVSTKSGFKVQEFCKIGDLNINQGTSLSPYTNIVGRLEPTKPDVKDYVIKAQGVIDVDFSKSNKNDTTGRSSTPFIRVESNMIDFGNDALAKKMENRSLGQMIVDFFKNLFGANKVKDISPQIKDPAPLARAPEAKNTDETRAAPPATPEDTQDEGRTNSL